MLKPLPRGHVSCLSPNFKYTPSTHTDIASTFARLRRDPKAKPVRQDDNLRPMRLKSSS